MSSRRGNRHLILELEAVVLELSLVLELEELPWL